MKRVGVARSTNWNWWREYSPGEKEAEAVGIGYKLVGPLEPSDRVFKPYDPIFAVVQVLLLLLRLLVSFFIGCLWGYWFFVIFLYLDWIAPVKGEQWGFDFHWEIEILRGEWQGGFAIEFAWIPIILCVHLYLVNFFFWGGNSMHC